MILFVVLSIMISATPRSAVGSAAWLDRSLLNWNTPGGTVPRAPAGNEPRDALLKRCGLTLRQTTVNERNLAAAGWIPFLLFDRQVVRDDVEVVHGMSGADEHCQPVGFNAFVFVAGRFAGTVSPDLMTAGHDGTVGPIRMIPPDIATVDFARYAPTNSECCPSSHVTVRYRIDRTGSQPLLVPLELRKTRGLH